MKPIRNLIFLILAFTFSKVATASQAEPLAETLDKLISARAAEGMQSAILVQEAETGRLVYAKSAELPLNPASNTKVLSTLAALASLGSDFTFKTQLLGIAGDKKDRLTNLTLKGFGDPLLSSADLEEMAAKLKEKGIRAVETLSVDGNYFDEGDFPGQMSGRQRDASFNCSVGALSVDHNQIFLIVSPGAKLGDAAKIEVDPPLPILPIEGEVKTQRKNGRIIVKNSPGEPEKLGISIAGNIGLRSAPLRYRISIHQPLQLAALRLREALLRQGISLPPETIAEAGPAKSKVLVEHQSPPLHFILQEINKRSDNFMAEQLTKALGAEMEGTPGTTAKGTSIILKKLHALGISTRGLELENGSGLSKINRVSAHTLAQALQAAYTDPKLRQDFLSSLSVLGVDGTLKRRFRHSELTGRFFGKTGSLSGVSSLSGYAFPKNSELGAYIYVFIVNGSGKAFWKEKQLGQDILQTLLNR